MATLAVLFVTPASAEPRQACVERGPVIKHLAEKYGETRQGMGLHQNGGVLEVYAAPKTGTWTVIVTMPNGLSCLLAAGQSWVGDALTPIGDPA